VVEGARLESVYRPKAYRGFESRSLRQRIKKLAVRLAFFVSTHVKKLAFVSEVKQKKPKMRSSLAF
jgi:hypothetical protein